MFEYNNPLTRATNHIMDSAAAAQRYRLGNMQIEEEQRKLDDAASLRAKLAGAQPTTTTDITPKVADAGTSRQMLGAELLPAQQYTQTPVAPAPLSGSLESEMQAQGLAEKPAVDATNFNIPEPEASPTVQAYNEGRVQTTTKAPNYYKVLIQHAQETGNVELMQKTRKDVVAHAQELIAMGGFSDGIKLMNETLGTKLSNQRAGKFDFIKDADGNTVSIFMEDTAKQLIASGVSPQEAVKQSTVEIDQNDNAGKQLAAYVVQKPDLTYKDAMIYLGENGLDPSSKAVDRVLKRIRENDTIQSADKRAEASLVAADERQNKQLAAADERLNKTLAAAERRAERAEQLKKTGKPLPAGQLESLSESANLIKTLNEAKGLASKVNTGFISGRAQSLGQKIGAAGDDFNQFKQKLSTVENIMLKLRSGAAVTESEYKRFMNEMPTINDDEKTRDVKLANSISYATELLNGKIDTYQEGGYKVPTGLIERSQAKGKGQPQANKSAPITTKGGFKVTVVQ